MQCHWSLGTRRLPSRKQGRYKEAEPLFQSALQTWEQHQGAEHPNVAIGLHNLARLQADQGKYAQAEPLYQRALRIREQRFGPEHPSAATTLNGIAKLYADISKLNCSSRDPWLFGSNT